MFFLRENWIVLTGTPGKEESKHWTKMTTITTTNNYMLLYHAFHNNRLKTLYIGVLFIGANNFPLIFPSSLGVNHQGNRIAPKVFPRQYQPLPS